MLVAVGLQRPNQPMSTLKTWDDMLSLWLKRRRSARLVGFRPICQCLKVPASPPHDSEKHAPRLVAGNPGWGEVTELTRNPTWPFETTLMPWVAGTVYW